MKEVSGRAKGGIARAQIMTAEERSESARKAALAKAEIAKLPKATHGSSDHPLRIGELDIPCYVLEDGRRVIVQRGVMTALDMSQGTAGRGGGDRLAKFVDTKAIKPFVDSKLDAVIKAPILFKTPNGSQAYGYEATVLADLCEAVLEARKNNQLHYQQEHIAVQCEVLIRAFAKVGIIALVDEATGYQRERAKDALAAILEAFVAKELQPYVKTFPPEFYENMFRLRGLHYPPERASYKPQYFGTLTNDVVYKRVAPGLLAELKKEAAKDERKGRLHQRLTPTIGHPKLREHLASVTTVMKLSKDYEDFIEKLDSVHPRYGDTMRLGL